MGRPLHPVLSALPKGLLTSAALLDLLPGERRTARRLVALGLLAMPAAMVTGFVDLSHLSHQQYRRAGLLHGAAHSLGAALYTASYAARVRGRGGRVTGLAGFLALSLGAAVGDDLARRLELREARRPR